MSTSRVQSCWLKYLSARTKCHLLLSIAGGVLITVLIVVASVIANHTGNERLGSAFLAVAFWTWGIFGAMFDSILGTRSYWIPNPLGLAAALFFDVVLYSLFSYIILWFIREFRYAGEVDV